MAVGLLEEDEDKPELSSSKDKEEPKPDSTAVLGLTLLPLTDEMRQRFSFDAKMKGVIVMDIDPGSAAASKNIKAGDVITEAQQEPVDSPDDIQAAVEKVKKSGGKSVLLLVEDAKGDTRFVAIPF